MRLSRDPLVCQACGHCALLAPVLFELRPGDDIVRVLHEVVPSGEEGRAEEAVGACPSGALSLR